MGGYPDKGILQIFIDGDEDCLYGADFDNPQAQTGWRILYHEDISEPMPVAEIKALMPETDNDDDDEWVLMWGDSGVANFFIATEDLKNRDFSRVYYTWDCY